QSGQLPVQHEDGSEATLNPGDVYECKPGHQARVVGDEPCVMIEFDSQTAETYAQD
ncbi:MAG TPA: cupin, partial [Gammaproteobacteria bacterium]|nr:cupin [Gammaproteobacteria bacterium]